jgi:hypothetical protein
MPMIVRRARPRVDGAVVGDGMRWWPESIIVDPVCTGVAALSSTRNLVRFVNQVTSFLGRPA